MNENISELLETLRNANVETMKKENGYLLVCPWRSGGWTCKNCSYTVAETECIFKTIANKIELAISGKKED